jgi:hypothetical protein
VQRSTLADADRFVISSRRILRTLGAQLGDESLQWDYKGFLYGGRRHRLGHWISKPHRGLMKFHEACKALFCPACRNCGKHNILCTCGNQDICWRHIGQAPVRHEAGGEGEEAIRTCTEHGDWKWRRAQSYSTIAVFPSNRWGKSAGAMAEFCAWLIGYRPWDDTLTCPPVSGQIFGIVVQTLSTSAKLNVEQYIEKYLRPYISRRQKNSSGGLDFMEITSPLGTNILKIMSQDQHSRTVAEVSPLEGPRFFAVAYDEPIKGDIRAAIARGLQDGKDGGWGRELFSGTALEGSPEAAAYSFNEIYQPAWNNGGRRRQVFAMSGTIWENPDLTEENIRQTIESWPPHEREARSTGIYKTLRGRILAEFDPEIHVWDDAQRDVLLNDDGTPSDWPLAIGVDPHDVRPWVFVVIAISPQGHWYIVREWPTSDFQQMRHYRAAGVDGSFEGYRRVIDGIIASVPGGRDRFVWWVMDPGFGDSEKAGSGQTVVKAMRQQGFYFRTDLPRSIEPGHAILRDKMRGSMEEGHPIDEMHRPHYYVATSCRNVIWSNLNYVIDEGSNPAKFREKPSEAGKDFIDPQRYIAMARPKHVPWSDRSRWYAEQQGAILEAMRFR